MCAFLCAQTGGHLGSSLGVVELTTALLYVFNLPDDKIVYDVGHQAYVHKMLTGRRKQMHTIRQTDGLSGAPPGTLPRYALNPRRPPWWPPQADAHNPPGGRAVRFAAADAAPLGPKPSNSAVLAAHGPLALLWLWRYLCTEHSSSRTLPRRSKLIVWGTTRN